MLTGTRSSFGRALNVIGLDSECPTTVNAENAERSVNNVQRIVGANVLCDRDTTVGQVHWRFAEQTPMGQHAQLVTDSLGDVQPSGASDATVHGRTSWCR